MTNNIITTFLIIAKHLGLTYASTVLLSTIMYGTLMLNIYKNMACDGYKLNTREKKFKVMGYDINNNLVPMKKILLVPFYNIFVMFNNTVHFNAFQDKIIFAINPLLTPLSEDEKTTFQSNPTGLRAYLITKKYALNFHFLTVNISKNGKYSTIKCILIKETLFILSVKGDMKRLKKEELEATVLDYLNDLNIMYQKEAESDENILDNISEYSEYTFDTTKFNLYSPEEINSCQIDGGEIIWAYTKDGKDIDILTSYGVARRLSELEQKKVIIEYLKKSSVVRDDLSTDAPLTRKREPKA